MVDILIHQYNFRFEVRISQLYDSILQIFLLLKCLNKTVEVAIAHGLCFLILSLPDCT